MPAQRVRVMLQYTPVKASRGRLVHATDLRRPKKTLCGITTKGWVVALGRLDCPGCKAEALRYTRLTPNARKP
jgi:hypothetical protein